jgi:hypothetical protein
MRLLFGTLNCEALIGPASNEPISTSEPGVYRRIGGLCRYH